MVDLKCFQKMARFCSREEIPQAVTDHVRHCLGLAPETEPGHGSARTAKWHRGQVRKRQGVRGEADDWQQRELVTSGPDFEVITSRVKAKYGLMVPITRLLDSVRHLGKGPFPYADTGVVITLQG